MKEHLTHIKQNKKGLFVTKYPVEKKVTTTENSLQDLKDKHLNHTRKLTKEIALVEADILPYDQILLLPQMYFVCQRKINKIVKRGSITNLLFFSFPLH